MLNTRTITESEWTFGWRTAMGIGMAVTALAIGCGTQESTPKRDAPQADATELVGCRFTRLKDTEAILAATSQSSWAFKYSGGEVSARIRVFHRQGENGEPTSLLDITSNQLVRGRIHQKRPLEEKEKSGYLVVGSPWAGADVRRLYFSGSRGAMASGPWGEASSWKNLDHQPGGSSSFSSNFARWPKLDATLNGLPKRLEQGESLAEGASAVLLDESRSVQKSDDPEKHQFFRVLVEVHCIRGDELPKWPK